MGSAGRLRGVRAGVISALEPPCGPDRAGGLASVARRTGPVGRFDLADEAGQFP
jgi:hypothetical protein